MQKSLINGKLLTWIMAIAVGLLMAVPANAHDVLPGIDLFHTSADHTWDSSFVFTPHLDSSGYLFKSPIAFSGGMLNTSENLWMADVMVERLDAALLPACPSSDSVRIIIRALDLLGETYAHDGFDSVRYYVRVCLSQVVPQDTGQMVIYHDCPEGGHFTSELPIEPRFTFVLDSPTPDTIVIDPAPAQIIMETLPANPGYWSHSDALANPIDIIASDTGGVVDHDCVDTTDMVAYPPSSNFVAGLRPYPCFCTSDDQAWFDQVQISHASGKVLTRELALLAAHGVFPPQPETNPEEGGCGLSDGSCIITTPTLCGELGGNYLGPYTECAGDMDGNGVDDAFEGNVPTGGSCCFDNGDCLEISQVLCETLNAIIPTQYRGDNTVCLGDGDLNGIDDLCEAPANPGLTIAQVDLTFTGAVQMDSRYGLVSVDYDEITASTGIGIGYLNMITSEGWVVRNLPIDTSSHFPGISVVFDLGGQGDVTDLPVYIEVTTAPVTSFAGTPNATYNVGSVEYNAQGRGAPVASPPNSPVNVGLLAFNPGGIINAIWQFFNPSVEQDDNQCGPASVANSLQWLENNGHITVEDEHVPGIRDGSMVGELDKDMKRQPHSTALDGDVLEGKLKYLGDEKLGNKLVCKHKNRVGSNFVSNNPVTVNGVTSTPNNDANKSLIEWVIEEIEAGEDVELAIGWPGGGGHWVRVNGGGHILGVPFITFVHDANQGHDNQGTPDDADDKTKINGGTGLLDGGLGFAFVLGDQFISWIGNGTIDLALSESPKEDSLSIEKTHGTYQGQHETVDVTLETSNHDFGGFDLLIAYDASALSLQAAIPGPAFYDPAPDGCGWEYFTYRYGPFGNCGDACPSGMVRVFGLAETNNGPNHPSCFMPDSLPAEFFSLDFLVSNDRTLECQYVPIRFFWTDCGDNSISSVDGEVLYVSDHVYEFEGTDITDSTFGFPTYFGVQEGCLNPDPDKPTAIQLVDFTNGGIDIVCADSIDDRGDINLNGVINEVADAVLYSNYFVHGISVFNVNIDGQIAASDVNADGITLSVADLVYMIRIITGDALPYPKLTPVMADADLVNGVLSVDADMGAAYVVVERSITPRLLAESMEMKYQYDADHDLTRILVYSMEQGRRFTGDFLGGIDGNVMTLEMATYDGAPVTTKLVPDEFALYPSYPNPFNPVTTISFALASLVDYELVIYNSLGQTVKTFSGHAGPGLERIDWNASGFASGVYFYRLTAGDFTDTRKMVLLK